MSSGTLPAADKRLLDELETECECYLLSRVSTQELLIIQPHPVTGHYFFRFHPGEVMAPDGWIMMKQEALHHSGNGVPIG
jgi:hypothetical protein